MHTCVGVTAPSCRPLRRTEGVCVLTALRVGRACLLPYRHATPQVHSVALTVFHRCFDHAGLARQMRAIGRWTQLRHLCIQWVSWTY